MNSTFYLFGKFNGNYAQFPVDYTQEIFRQLANRSSFANTQLVIHREGNLMYYSYMRKLEQENYIGFCLLLNDTMIMEIPALFDLFDNGISHLALNGEIVKINDNGDIVSNTDSLLSNRQTIQRLSVSMTTDLNKLEGSKRKLPPLSYGTSAGEVKRFSFDDDESTLARASYTYAYTYISKEEDIAHLDSYRDTIKRLNKQKQALTEENDSLKEQVRKLTKQKKQQNMVLMLCGVVAACLCFVFFLQKTINRTVTDLQTEKANHLSTQQMLDNTKQNLEEERTSFKSSLAIKNKAINKLNSSNADLKNTVADLENNIKQLNNQLYSYRDELQKVKEQRDLYRKERDDYSDRNRTLIERLRQRSGGSSTNNNDSYVNQPPKANAKGIAYAFIAHDVDLYSSIGGGKKVTSLRKGWRVEVFVSESKNNYYRIRYGSYEGYVYERALNFMK